MPRKKLVAGREKLTKAVEKLAHQATYAELTRSIAHEIRNPMTVLLTSAELVSKQLDDKETVKKFAEVVKKNILRLITITETMLKYGKPIPMEKTKMSVNELLEDILLLAEAECGKREIKVVKEMAELPSITGDPNRLNQAFMNIILNGIQAIDREGALSVSTSAVKFKNRDGVKIIIKDTGSGIPPKDLSKIFKQFFTTKHGAAGLGLSIASKIIDEHGGTIDIDSEVGKGTIFIVYLPA